MPKKQKANHAAALPERPPRLKTRPVNLASLALPQAVVASLAKPTGAFPALDALNALKWDRDDDALLHRFAVLVAQLSADGVVPDDVACYCLDVASEWVSIKGDEKAVSEAFRQSAEDPLSPLGFMTQKAIFDANVSLRALRDWGCDRFVQLVVNDPWFFVSSVRSGGNKLGRPNEGTSLLGALGYNSLRFPGMPASIMPPRALDQGLDEFCAEVRVCLAQFGIPEAECNTLIAEDRQSLTEKFVAGDAASEAAGIIARTKYKPLNVEARPSPPALSIPISERAAGYLNDLVAMGLWGETAEDVAATLVHRQLSDLISNGTLSVSVNAPRRG